MYQLLQCFTVVTLSLLSRRHTQAFARIICDGCNQGDHKQTHRRLNVDTSRCELTQTSPPPAIASDVPGYVASLGGHVNGELKKWHRVTLGFQGPLTCEQAVPNPFTDYRLDVTFVHVASTRSYVVPGFYAADGNAANTGASSGNVWLTHFSPDEIGAWTWSATFTQGTAVAQNGSGSSAGYFDGATGAFVVGATDKTGRDHRGKGRLQYVGEHYLQFAETGEWFLKAGADSPENFLAYEGFDNTPDNHGLRKSWSYHEGDYVTGHPTWMGGKGKGVIGGKTYFQDAQPTRRA